MNDEWLWYGLISVAFLVPLLCIACLCNVPMPLSACLLRRPKPTHRSRALGLLEQWYFYQKQQRIVLGAITLHLTEMQYTNIRDAMSAVIVRHPTLAAVIDAAQRIPLFRVRDDVETVVRQCVRDVTLHDDTTVRNVMSVSLNEEFDMQQPLWRLTVIASDTRPHSFECHFVLSAHHLLLDGMSIKIIFNDLVNAMADTSVASTFISQPLSLLRDRPADDFIDLNPTLAMIVEAVTNLRLHTRSARQMTIEDCEKSLRKEFIGPQSQVTLSPPPTTLRTALTVVRIDGAVLSALKSRVAAERISLHCVLIAVSNFALSSAVDREPPFTTVMTPINIRSRSEDPAALTMVGCFLAAYKSYHCLTPQTSIMSLAREVQSDLVTEGAIAYRRWGLLRLTNIPTFLEALDRSLQPTLRDATLELSNLGAVDFGNSSLAVSNVMFTQANHYRGPAVCQSLVTHSQTGDLINCITYPVTGDRILAQSLLSAQQIDCYCQQWQRCLERFATDGNIQLSDWKKENNADKTNNVNIQ